MKIVWKIREKEIKIYTGKEKSPLSLAQLLQLPRLAGEEEEENTPTASRQ